MSTLILTVLASLIVLDAAFRNGRTKRNLAIIKQYRIGHFLSNIPVIVLVLGTATLLINYVPWMDKNPIMWLLSILFNVGDGSGTGNFIFAGMQWKWFMLIFLPVLMFALPNLARDEEIMFRLGTRDWKHGIVRSFTFGMIHLIMLIPIGGAVALSIGGLWFTYQYFKGGVDRSTVYHSMYNTMIIGIIFVSLIAS